MRSSRALLLVIAVAGVAAVMSSACLPLPTPLGSLAMSRIPQNSATGNGFPITPPASEAAALTAKPVVLANGGSLDLVEGETLTIDLTGSWLAWQPMVYVDYVATHRGSPKWVCANLTSAFFTVDTSPWIVPVSALIGMLMQVGTRLAVQGTAIKADVSCLTSFAGTRLTVTAPAFETVGQETDLWLMADSGGVPIYLKDSPTRPERLVGSDPPVEASAIIPVNLHPKGWTAAATAAAAATPTARIVSRAAPVWVAGGAFTDARTLWYEVDARSSTDSAGGALTYSWDLDGDGVYGDTSAAPDPAGTLPTGVAIASQAALNTAANASADLTVGVKVTNAAGATSTATTTIHPLPNQSYNGNYRSDFTLDTATPAVGATVTLTLETPMSTGGYGCVDADADGVYETTVSLPTRSGPALSTGTTTTAALAAGPHVVTVVFISRYFGATCANPAADATPLTFRQVYTSTAARRGHARVGSRAAEYSAATTIRLVHGRTLEPTGKSRASLRLDGEVMGGGYRWWTPRRAAGVVRPGALGAFARGAYAASFAKATTIAGASGAVGIGYGSMLLRGARAEDLLCLDVRSLGSHSATHIVGGTGAGASLRGSLVGTGFSIPFDAVGVVGATGSGKGLALEYGQVKPFTNRATLTASTGAARTLPKACRALVRYLPKIGGDGGSTTPSVVTG